MDDDQFEEVFRPRGISREVAEYGEPDPATAGFVRYEQGDVGAVLAADPQLLDRQGWTMLAEARANRAGGIMMRRWAVPEGDETILSEMRPDRPVYTGLNPAPHGKQSHRKMSRHERVDHVTAKVKVRGKDVRDGLTKDEYEALAKRYPWCATHQDDAGVYYAEHDGVRLDLGADHGGQTVSEEQGVYVVFEGSQIEASFPATPEGKQRSRTGTTRWRSSTQRLSRGRG